MSLPNAYLQSLVDVLNDPTTTAENIDRRIFGEHGMRQAVLALLLGTIAAAAAGTTPVQRTPAVTRATAGGSVSAGKRSIAFIPSSDFSGSIGGASYTGTDPGFAIQADGNNTLGALAYTVSAGSLLIVTMV